jgi:RNA polymerase sigma factor (sigma-70 family)
MEPLDKLVIAARAGDRSAYAQVVARFEVSAQTWAFHALRDRQLAEDAVQEAFAEAFLNLDKLREPAAFPGWFKRIVIKRVDRITRGKHLPTVSLEAAVETPHSEGDSGDALDDAATAASVQASIDFLPEHEREVARLYYFEGKSQQEIGESLGLPVTTIKKRLYASRQRLKQHLRDLDPFDAAALAEDDLPLDAQLFAAARHGFVYKVDALLQRDPRLVHARNEDGLSIPLYAAHAAHHSGNMGVVELLLARGAKVDLHLAAALGMAQRLDRFVAERQDLAAAAASWGRTPLHWAASGGHTRLVARLLELGADANARDRFGCTPLHLAAELARADALSLLLDAGADLNARLRNGKSVMHLAAQRRDRAVLSALAQRGGRLDIFAASSLGFIERVREFLKHEPGLVEARLPFGATPLHMAAEDGQQAMAEFLVARGAPVDVVCAAELGWSERLQRLIEAAPEAVNQKGGSFGFTPLHSATSKGRRDLARLLLVRGAEVNATDDMFDKTPLGEALYYGHEAMARLLYKHGARE